MLGRLLIALIALVASATGAMAHAGLISTDPAEGAVLASEPAGIALTYTEPVSPIGFSIVGLDGAPTPLVADRQDGPLVHVPLPPGLANGSYLFSWRVTSEDGHPVNGTVSFAVGAPSGAITATTPDPMMVGAIWAVRALQYIALFLGVGSAAFGALAPLPRGIRRVSRGLSIGGLVLVAPALALQGLDLLGLPFAAVLTTAPWSSALASPYAQTEALLALAFVLALLPGRIATLAAGLIGALAPTLSGHASTADPQLLMRGAVFVHMASLLFWLGSLLPLLVLLRRGEAAALRQFSRRIPWVIGLLLLSGTTLAVVQLGPPRDDWLSAYGLVLAAKAVLVTLLLLLALWNRVRLTTPAYVGDAHALCRSIVIELVLVVAILGMVAGWRFTTPPRVLAQVEAATAPIMVALTAPAGHADLEVSPGRPGLVSLDVALPVTAEEVTVTLDNPGAQIATIARKATRNGDGWRVDGLLLPAGGDWSVGVAARTGKFDITTFTGTLSLVGKDNAMTPATKAAIAVSSMLLATPVAAAGILPSCPTGQNFTHGAITVTGAYTRATPKAAQSAGAYFTVFNAGPDADTLTGASTEAATDAMLHVMKMNGSVMEMTDVTGGLPVPPGGTATLDPMGYHLMLTGMSAPFVEGQCLQMVLHFAKAGDIPIELNVGGFGQKTPPMESSSMEMSGMSSMQGM